MRYPFSLSLLGALLSVVLVACGGGGGDPPPSTTSAGGGTGSGAPGTPTVGTKTPTVLPLTDLQAKSIASLAAISEQLIATHDDTHIGFAAGYLQGLSTSAVGTTLPFTENCASFSPTSNGAGTLTTTITKSGTYAGMKTGDRVAVQFSPNCSFDGLTLSGGLTLTARADFGALNASDFSVQFTMNESNFRIDFGNGPSIGAGQNIVNYTSKGSNRNYSATTAPTYLVEFPANAGSLKFTMGVASRSINVSTATVSLTTTGIFTIVPNATSNLTFTRVSELALSGTYIDTPTAGRYVISAIGGAPAAASVKVNVQGATTTVTADKDGNAVTDYTLNTTYAQLLQ